MLSEVLKRRDYGSLKALTDYMAASQRRGQLLREIKELETQAALGADTGGLIVHRTRQAKRQQQAQEKAQTRLADIDARRLAQLDQHISSSEFASTLGPEISKLSEERAKYAAKLQEVEAEVISPLKTTGFVEGTP